MRICEAGLTKRSAEGAHEERIRRISLWLPILSPRPSRNCRELFTGSRLFCVWVPSVAKVLCGKEFANRAIGCGSTSLGTRFSLNRMLWRILSKCSPKLSVFSGLNPKQNHAGQLEGRPSEPLPSSALMSVIVI